MNAAARIDALGKLSSRWLDRRFRFRLLAVRRLVTRSGFAPAAAEAMLDALFRELTTARLKTLVRLEAGSVQKLDAARGPRTITHVLSGNVPNPGVQSIVFGLLVKAENRVKPSSRDEGIADLYAASLRRFCPALARACRILEPSDRRALRRAIAASDRVVAYGSDASVAAVGRLAGPGKAFTGYGQRVSFSIVTRAAQTRSVARATALDVWMADRRGCLSPALIFVQRSRRSERFVSDVAAELASLESKEGRARADVARAAAVRRAGQRARLNGHFFAQTPKARYFVTASFLGREGWIGGPGAEIRYFRSPEAVLRHLARFRRVLQACAFEGAASERRVFAQKLARLGFNRITRAGRLQFPPITWPHDGRPNFADWLAWDRSESGRIRG